MMLMRQFGSRYMKLLPFALICHILCFQKDAPEHLVLVYLFSKGTLTEKCSAPYSDKPLYILQERSDQQQSN